jgi:hypothetical protein
VQPRQFGRAALVSVERDVVADGVGRPQPDHPAGLEPALSQDALQHGPGVAVEVARRLAYDVVLEDLRIAAD